MDIAKIIESLGQGGNSWIILALLAFMLFKDKIFPPKTPPVVTPPTTPAEPVVPAITPERPIIDAIVKLLPVIIPVILPLITKGAEAQARELERTARELPQ